MDFGGFITPVSRWQFYLFSVIPFNTPNSPSYWQSDFSGQSTFDTLSGWPEKKIKPIQLQQTNHKN